MSSRLALEWSYTPPDFIEASLNYTETEYTVHIEDGRVVATFTSEQPDSVSPEVQKELESRFLGARPHRNKPFQLSGYNTNPGTLLCNYERSVIGGAFRRVLRIVV